MKKFLTKLGFILLTFVPGLAFADGLMMPQSPYAPVSTDYSVAFLSQLFGRVGTVLSGSPDSLLSRLFLEYSTGVIMIGGMLLFYFLIRSIIDTAHDGQFLGKKLGHWTLVRTVAGLAMLVPKFGGYSLIQLWVMWAVVQGVALADHTWNMGLDYLYNGGALYTMSSSGQNLDNLSKNDTVDAAMISPQLIQGKTEDDSEQATAIDMLRSAISLEALNQLAKDRAAARKADLAKYPNNYTADEAKSINAAAYNDRPYKEYFDEGSKTLLIPGAASNDMSAQYFPQLPAGMVGAYSWKVNIDAQGSSNAESGISNYEADKEKGLKTMFANLDGLAKILVQQATTDPGSTVTDATRTAIATQLLSSALQYQINTYLDRIAAARGFQANAGVNNQSGTNFGAAENYGWITAGGYYLDIIKLNSTAGLKKDLDTNNYFPLIQAAHGSIGLQNNYPPAKNSKDTNRTTSYQYLQSVISKDFTDNSGKNYSGQDLIDTMLDWSAAGAEAALQNAQSLNAQAATTDATTNDLSNQVTGLGKILSAGNIFKQGALLGAKMGGPLGLITGLMASTVIVNMLDPIAKEVGFHFSALDKNFFTRFMFENMGQVSAGHSDSNVGIAFMQQHPIVILHDLGVGMIQGAINGWKSFGTITIIALTTNMVAEGIITGAAALTAINPIVSVDLQNLMRQLHNFNGTMLTIMMTLIGIVLPIVLALASFLFTIGVTWAYYIPLIPLLIFTFGVISWLIFVVEAMAAAPLIGLGLTHPEGHDVLGKAEQAVMLLFSVFVRPTLMIIGLFAAIILSKLALTLLIMVFTMFLSSQPFSGDTTISSAAGLFMLLPIAIIATFAIVAIQNQVFELIVVLPDKVGRWIGISGGSDPGKITQMLGTAREGLGQAAGAMDKGVSGSKNAETSSASRPRHFDNLPTKDNAEGATGNVQGGAQEENDEE